jgi:serine/threonine-protein kinase
MAVPFDIRRLEVTGEAVALIEGVVVGSGSQATQFAISESGTLVYLAGGPARLSQIVRVTREGAATPVDPNWEPDAFYSLAVSPDETRLAVSISTSSLNADVTQHIWVKQLDRGPLTPLTFEGTVVPHIRPAWKTDDSLSFVSWQRDIWIARADGSGEPKVVANLEQYLHAASWSNDGKWLLTQVAGPTSNRDIEAWRVGADNVAVSIGRIVASPADEFAPALSPDGRWLAYVSREAGQREVFVSPFPNAGDRRQQVSSGGGGPPVWARSGRELFYDNGSSMVAVPVANAQTFQPGAPEVLFATEGYVSVGPFPQFAVTRDGQFIMARYVDVATLLRINVWVNFFEELKVRVGR